VFPTEIAHPEMPSGIPDRNERSSKLPRAKPRTPRAVLRSTSEEEPTTSDPLIDSSRDGVVVDHPEPLAGGREDSAQFLLAVAERLLHSFQVGEVVKYLDCADILAVHTAQGARPALQIRVSSAHAQWALRQSTPDRTVGGVV
jgi:hypothetical protein